ncbi:Vitamin B12 import ATP-binding protein BtuD [Streptomyces griseoloalbus]
MRFRPEGLIPNRRRQLEFHEEADAPTVLSKTGWWMTMTTDTTTKDTAAGAPAPGTVVLDARGVTMRFGGLTAVRDVDLTVRSGEIVGSIGPNGAGKTTFFNCLTGLYIPTEGEVRYKDKVLPPKSFKGDRGRHCPYVPEHPAVRQHDGPGRTCSSAATPAPRRASGLAVLRGPGFHKAEAASRARAMELLEFVGLAEKAEQLARNLPYGEQRKLEIARALASEPGLLLLDEPTAGMNPQETRAAEELIFAGQTRAPRSSSSSTTCGSSSTCATGSPSSSRARS